MRFGESELVKSYGAAGGAVDARGAALFDISSGKLRQDNPEARRRLDEAAAVFRDSYETFLREARRWHED
jgi:hypothetical protein